MNRHGDGSLRRVAMNGFLRFLLLMLIGAAFVPSPALGEGAPPYLDTNFNPPAGYVVNNSYPPYQYGWLVALAAQPDGKVVLGGYLVDELTQVQFILVERLNADGTRDTTFGTAGLFTLNYGYLSGAGLVTVVTDGKIVVAGGTILPSGEGHLIVFRLNADGTLDESFADQGIYRENQMANFGAAAMTVREDGRILLAGHWIDFSQSPPRSLAVVRQLDAQGNPDSTFGGGSGYLAWYWPSPYFGTMATSLDILPGGGIVIAGTFNQVWTAMSHASDLFVRELNADGSPLSGFGDDGVLVWDSGGLEYYTFVTAQPDGKVVVSLTSYTANDIKFELVLARFLADASLDPAFGEGGVIRHDHDQPFPTLQYGKAHLLADGKLLVFGQAYDGVSIPPYLLQQTRIWRFLPDGTPDATFGEGGLIPVNIRPEGESISGLTEARLSDRTWYFNGLVPSLGQTFVARHDLDDALQGRPLLTVQKTGRGTGTISAPPWLSCMDTCSGSYTSGTPIHLTAIAAAGSYFKGWEGCVPSDETNCQVVMDTDRTVTARFESAVRITAPKSGSVVKPTDTVRITWKTHLSTPVFSTHIFWALRGGFKWRPLARLQMNPSQWTWNVASLGILRGACKLRVVLKDGVRNVLAQDTTPGYVLIKP